MQIYDDKYMSYKLKDDRMDFIWQAETENMTDYDFQYSILRYASYIMEYKIKKVLIDLLFFVLSTLGDDKKYPLLVRFLNGWKVDVFNCGIVGIDSIENLLGSIHKLS